MDNSAVTDASGKPSVDIVLEGGGVKGIALVGALKEICAAHTVQRVAGTSAGAIVAALLAAGYTVPELEREMRSLDFAAFQDGPARRFGKVGAALAVLLHNGVFKGDALHTWIEERLADKNITTFQQLRRQETGDDAGTPPYRLAVVVSDVSRGRELHLPEDYQALCGVEPDTAKVADAVRASASIPFYFRPVRFLTGPSQGSQRLAFVDGGLLSNFPVDMFDRRDTTPPRWPTIGVKLSMRRTLSQEWQPVRNPVELARRLVATMTGAHDQLHVGQSCVQDRTVFVDTTGIRSTDFHITREQTETLFTNGRTAAEQFLATWDFQQWLNRCHPSRNGARTPS